MFSSFHHPFQALPTLTKHPGTLHSSALRQELLGSHQITGFLKLPTDTTELGDKSHCLSLSMAHMEGGFSQHFTKPPFPGFPASSGTFLPGKGEESLRRRFMNGWLLHQDKLSHLPQQHLTAVAVTFVSRLCLYWKWVNISWEMNRTGALATKFIPPGSIRGGMMYILCTAARNELREKKKTLWWVFPVIIHFQD